MKSGNRLRAAYFANRERSVSTYMHTFTLDGCEQQCVRVVRVSEEYVRFGSMPCKEAGRFPELSLVVSEIEVAYQTLDISR